MTQTQREQKISQLIKSSLPESDDQLVSAVKVQIAERADHKKIMMVRIAPVLLARLRDIKFVDKVRAMHPDYTVFLIQDRKDMPCSDPRRNSPIHKIWMSDLCYPSLITLRSTEVHADGTRLERVEVERKCDFDEDDFKSMECAFTALTGKEIKYELKSN
ncbi:40S ribosomal protein S7 [Astathelohania contejeani]|uniref:40S ribosomal protein S7 n=1 Tax=Astathelohania contejeani TaxID=164912 RepID=A0ABQ7I1Y3_9MICR|nr:40S ribosomal protein S7 [Thelohania contejeani]